MPCQDAQYKECQLANQLEGLEPYHQGSDLCPAKLHSEFMSAYIYRV